MLFHTYKTEGDRNVLPERGKSLVQPFAQWAVHFRTRSP